MEYSINPPNLPPVIFARYDRLSSYWPINFQYLIDKDISLDTYINLQNKIGYYGN